MPGGYIAGTANLVDAVRSHAHGFIFTTALPPAVCAAATAVIRHLKTSQQERQIHQERAALLKAALEHARLPVMSTDTHIVPVLVGDPQKRRAASDLLLTDHGIYIQPINYPTVPRGAERLLITPSPLHDIAMIHPLVDVWRRLDLRFLETAPVEYALGGRRHVYLVPAPEAVEVNGMRIGARDGTASKDAAAVRVTPIEDSELVTVDAP